ncbi:glycosyltransferase family 2 protein [Pantoea dispersa]|uniref:glycosyltransferase family 2 protein n=1 Tax=Pantoea dispersa TaxID=59814 RepID=UPI002DB60C36|nr:glycosyltransferase family 2 protein [Pantoea dispersa]MEB5836185.1 glycosyltransferase family 2 protein [Pantoea dispersa]
MEISNKLVSVCILTKNPGSVFKSVLDSVLRQKTVFDYEVVIVDSGSNDGTIEYVKNINSPIIKLIEIKPEDFGHGKTRNFAISQSKGDYIAMITHDANPTDESWLQHLIAPFADDEKIAGVFGRHYAYQDATIFTKRDLKLHFDNFANGPKVVFLEDKQRYSSDIGYRQWLHYFSDNNAALKRSVWEVCPYPDVDFAEDQLWAKNIIERGYKKAYADNAVVYHSHNYDLNQTLRRSYDESRALKKLFGYKLCPSFLNIFYQTIACTKRDVSYQKNIAGDNSIKAFSYIISWHFLKQLGYYLGDNFYTNKKIYNFLSLDNSLKRKGK